ncbi:MAG: glycosyltransferase family 4 protein [Lachnospiraceae bacterium]|nr:glycosyltransferase family 4 protein [Lachnospiraceae bacterium]
MKILYLTLSKIELHKQGIYSDLINALSSAGHEVTVLQVCEPKDTRKTRLVTEGSIRILKVVVGALFGVNFIIKGINTVKIAPMLKRAIRTYLNDDHFDLILYATPPITFAGVVEFAKKKYGAKSFLMLKDIFPQNAVDIGLFSKKSPLYTYFRRREKKLYELSDRIGCMSDANRKYLFAHNPELNDTKVLIFPNTQKVTERPHGSGERSEGEALKFVFGGNFGKPQAIDFLIRAISDPRMQELNARFLFVGNGSETEKVKRAAESLPNMEYIPFMPPEEYDRFMAGCDVGLISLDHRFTIPNYPSRTLSYMSMAKPVLAATDEVTDIKELVLKQARCGLWCSSDDVDGFIGCVKEFCSDPGKCREYGENGRRYFESHFDVKQSVACIETIMKGMEDNV